MSSPLCSLHWLHLKAAASEALPFSFFKNQGYFFGRPVPAEELRQLLLGECARLYSLNTAG